MKKVLIFLTFSLMPALLPAAEPPPPEPSSTSLIGDTVTNPVTASTTTVSGLMLDPAGTPTAGATAFVQTADGYAFLIKSIDQIIYNQDAPPVGFKILSKDTTAKTVTLQLASDATAPTATLSYQLLQTDLDAQFAGAETPGVVTPPILVTGASGVKLVSTGDGGSNGRNGALFVPPTNGGDGDDGPAVSYTNTVNINTSNKIGIEAGSVGGKGGKGGNSYASFWEGRDGGDGGAGGPVTVVNNAGIQVATNGDNMHGIFAYSRSGQAGDGGSGYAAPGGGTGGHSSDGGSVTVTNHGTISTTGAGAFGIYGLSVSNNGGNGGDTWGLVGESGDGSYGGNGGAVTITNSSTGTIFTSGNFAHGILAQSIGGTGGSSGTSGNLLISLNGSADNGGNGGNVTVNNAGSVTTTGTGARGIFAQSIGGGGGSAGTNVGLVLALGGSGSNGGSAGTVTVRNYGTGHITTQGVGSDGIFAQSVGGSGGSGSNSFGLIAVGGSGSKAGNGGAVTVENLGAISTQGIGARGIVAQSIGGGGGDGGSSGGMVSVGGSGSGGGTGAAVTVLHGGSITTWGDDARGILAQSVGGGGGNGGSAGSLSAFAGLAIGGSGGAGGAGGTVGVTLQGDGGAPSILRTYGDRSTGLFAQSVGGGGGSGGGAVQVTGGYLGALSIAIGGQGGLGGAGGTVSLQKGTGTSNVWTDGIDSTGVSLQSVGGGGGTGGFAVAVALSGGEVATSLSVGVGGSGGSGGAGGSVTAGTFDGSNAMISSGYDGSVITHGANSVGFLAQSVGGGGGNGGLSVSVAGSGSLFFSGSIAVGVGGSGASGGAGGLVRVGTQGNITTTGANSTALLAQSIGGGGGNGGGSIAASGALSGMGAGSFSLGIGGQAANGSSGGQVVLATRSGTISTSGENSIGILAQSVGGGGGNGGYTVAAGVAGAGAGAGAVNIGIGGSGGGGGAGGSVTADLQSNVFTSSNNSTGILVQSIGGGGGNGGFSVTSGGAAAGFGSGGVSVGVGGWGGDGGIGNAVRATSTGSIATSGDNSAGFVAQSIGGGGGNGGFSVTVAGSAAILGGGALSLSVGGSGGAGNHGGMVVAETNTGTITTGGNDSIGVLAQSLGGGGGNGGFSVSVAGSGAGVGSGSVGVGVGGMGSSGGNAGSVQLTVRNAVTTSGKRSSAVVAQSLGGGGGNGGFNVTVAGSGSAVGSGTLSAGVGGFGAGGGTGGDVTVLVTGNLDTLLEGSGGLLAQSIGGGGGNGGFDFSLSGSGAGVGSGAISFGMGGFGGAGGDAGWVNATSTGTIITRGNDAPGFLAQSIGGGGGNGGFNVSLAGSGAGVGSGGVTVGLGGFGAAGGNAGSVTASVSNHVTTLGSKSTAVAAQSIGGGGGNGGFNVSLAGSGAGTGSGAVSVGLGGFAAGGGNGADVELEVNGNLDTLLDGSGGLLAQSIGGGGGNGGFNISLSGTGAGVGSGALSFGMGGFGGAGGTAGQVSAISTGTIITRGHDAVGFAAQSIGGGGGNGGFDISIAGSGAGTGSGAVSIGLGGFGGGGGNAGNVTGSTSANITTLGNNSGGILAQSIGGGGGNGGFDISLAISGAGTGSGAVAIGLGGFGAAAGNAGTVGLTVANDVHTSGNDAAAILAQSIGGGGGNGGFDISGAISGAGTGSGAVGISVGGFAGGGGSASAVTTGVTGQVVTLGNGSGGVISQSLGGGGGNGGFSIAGALSFAGTGTGAVSLGIGGAGGDGGDAGQVTSTLEGSVYTTGADSLGVAAQSIGGGGGNGGFSVSATIAAAQTGAGAVALGIGGFGGGGGDAANVINALGGYIQTTGDRSTGFLSQSLGGGGGNGGLNVSASITASLNGSGALALGMGGFGGDGGLAGNVINNLVGGVVTSGDFSDAILAQSIGGGGGNGGLNVSAAVNLSKQNGGAVGLGVGGFGGGGGDAGSVVGNYANTAVHSVFATIGDNSSAIVAQSLGGGGGNGGINVTGAVNITGESGAAIGLGLGGFGGAGGGGYLVDLDIIGQIVTYGDLSHGVLAQSIGGGGGNGGIDVTGAISATKGGSGGTTAAIALGVGGFGGGGGSAGQVNVDFDGSIYAQTGTFTPASGGAPALFIPGDGAGSHGLAAQSIGGGGGNGGINVSAGLAFAGGDADGYGIVAGVGGFGGAGGSADAVTVNVTGGQSITGYGAGHSAILAQSVGGGGGNGGINVTGGVVSDSNLFVGVGGFGADAGTAGNVTVDAVTDVFANALDSLQLSSAGVMAQSIGGGGGNGGLNVTGGITIDKESIPSVNLGIGGFGGSGASSGDVTVNLTGNALTSGDWIHGIMAQSLAGGGGNGGINATGALNFSDSEANGGKTDISVVAGIGGYAGDGANAGNVVVTNTGIVTTSGDYARGVAGQSIGGGGGTGGMNFTGIFTQKSSPITVGVGGSGGTGGHAGMVTVGRGLSTAWAGKVTTDGIGAHAIEASSIGGGGGNAGMNLNVGFSRAGAGDSNAGFAANILIGGSGDSAGNGNTVLVNNFSNIETKQDSAYGILGQSIGGGGGSASFNVGVTYAGANEKNMGLVVAIGGGTGEGGTGGLVTVNQTGDLSTAGRDAIGILAQSIGGGGGNAGLDFGFNVVDGASASISIGRRGGTGGDGGNVNLSYLGSLLTRGDGAFGLLAQSLGNGGGNSSSVSISGSVPGENKTSHSAGLSIGLEGGEGGRAGDVLLNSGGTITTNGKRAHAVFAQSVGGGGGNGGMANNLGLTPAVASLSLGGTGGTGGIGGDVTVNNTAIIHTNSEEAVGILAQSIGGGGGSGGMATNGALKSGDSGISVGIGGSGGTGLTGGTVTVNNSSIVITDGLAAHALLAQSIGGGGGVGGMAVSAILLPPKSDSDTSVTRVAINVGGSGGDGGAGGAVNVTNTGGLGTYQAASVGLFAQSIGGGGGNAGTVITGTVAGKDGNNFSLAIGGSGGTGGTGGAVTVKNQKTTEPNSALIITAGDFAHGILAMSVGGGGGNGSDVFTFNSPGFSSSGSASYMGISIGGSGGTGGTGGLVDVLNEGLIQTYGGQAHGIIAQSIGGGGGNGGMAITGDLAFGSGSSGNSGTSLEVSIGGFGGDGNAGGNVNVTNTGTIDVRGEKSFGILAQSVGGGGGDGGFAASFSRNLLTNPKQNLGASLMTFALGGFGGSGGDGGDVYVNNTGSITAHGDDAYGIFAQSVSGGGGNSSLSFSSPVWMAANLLIDTIAGGEGASGTAGTVTIDSTGNITMLGSNSIAQFAQSVNGGGGNVNQFMDFSQQAAELGDDGLPLPGTGGDYDKAKAFVTSVIQMGANFVTDVAAKALDAMHLGDLFSSGDDSSGGLLQSIGGGGGRGNQNISISEGSEIDLDVLLGGNQVSNSNGGDITYTQTGDVSTFGDQGAGLVVESIGGGGGMQIVTLQIVPDLVDPPLPSSVVTTAATLGGDAGTSNNGGIQNLTFSGASLTTSGDRSPGLLLQSIGGGGGALFLTGADALDIDIGGKNGASGNGGTISLQNSRAIATSGELSHGMLVQSIGGGGGAVFTDLDPSLITVIANTTNSGNGGNLEVTQTGDITVEGARATGIILQTLGGGGGIVDDLFSGTAGGTGSSGSINLVLNGSVEATGQGGSGLFAQSVGSTGQGDMDVTLAAGQAIMAGPGGIAVRFEGGADNSFTNNGSIGGADGVFTWALTGTDGNVRIENNGVFTGQINLGGGTNSFFNSAEAVLVKGPQFLLGDASSQLVNDGALHPGGTGLALLTDVTGSLVQNAGAVIFAELDFGTGLNDQIHLDGTASLAGQMDVALLNPGQIPSGHNRYVLVDAAGGVTDNGMFLTTLPSQVVQYELLFPDANTAVLDMDVDFSLHGALGRNLQEVGDYFNRIQSAGSSPELAETVTRILYEPSQEGYKALLSDLGPDFYAEQQAEMIRGSLRFGETMLAGGGCRFQAQGGRRWWVDVSNAQTHHAAFDDYKAARMDSFIVAAGAEQDWQGGDWTGSIALGLEENTATGYGNRWNAKGGTQRVGFGIRRKLGSVQLAGLLGYGWNEMDSSRRVQVTTPFSARANRDLEAFNAMIRLSKEVSHDDFFCRPMFDVGYSQLMADDATETGAGPTSLALESYDESHGWIRPAAEFGKIIPLNEKTSLRVRGSAGYQRFVTGEETSAAAKFIGAPEDVPPMDVPVDIGSMIRLSIGADLLFSPDTCLGVHYTKALADEYDVDMINVRFTISF